MLDLLNIEQIGLLRQTAANTAYTYPYRPLMLELALVGLSRVALSKLTIFSFSAYQKKIRGGVKVETTNCVTWLARNQVEKCTHLSDKQWAMSQDYLLWREVKVYAETDILFISDNIKDKKGYWEPMPHEFLRDEIFRLARDCYLENDCLMPARLEISHIHKSMANIMRFQGVPEDKIFELYGNKRYRDRS